MMFTDSKFLTVLQISSREVVHLTPYSWCSMRSALYHNDPRKQMDPKKITSSRGVGWHSYRPMTNALWLHYILVALKNQLDSSTGVSTSKGRVSQHLRFDEDSDRDDDDDLNNTYERRLAMLEKDLDPREQSVASWWTARGVVDYALRRGWLDEQDVIEC